jgi:hypothetical protein
MLKCILEKFYELNLRLNLLFTDFKQVYEAINRRNLNEIVKELGIQKKFVILIKIMFQESKQNVKIQGQFTEAVGITRAWRQSDALSTTLFNIVLEKVIKNIETKRNGTVFKRKRRIHV